MGHHFCAFSFVDRITAFEPGVRISGEYAIPAGITEFPPLVAEATGQFAAWSVMAAIDFHTAPSRDSRAARLPESEPLVF